MRIGGLVSSCNEMLEGETVVVETDADLVWTTELHERERSGGHDVNNVNDDMR
jgi:hypothetical protein